MADRIQLIGPGGTLASVDAADLEQAKRTGYREVTPEEAAEVERKKRLQATYGDTTGQLASAAIGAGRGLSFGAIDPVAMAIGGVIGGVEGREHIRQTLNAAREANPNATFAGELAGNVAGAALMPELGLAERGVARVLGPGSSALGNAARQMAAGGLSGMADGAAIGFGQEASEVALADDDLTAENVLASMGHGALMGATVGAGLRGAAAMASGGARSLANAAAGAVGAKDANGLSEFFQKKANEYLGQASGASKRFVKKADKFLDGLDGMGEVFAAERPEIERIAGQPVTMMDHATAAEAVTKRLDEVATQKLTPVYAETDAQMAARAQAGEKVKVPNAIELAQRINNEVIAPHMEAAATHGNSAPLQKMVADLLGNNGVAVDPLTGVMTGSGDMTTSKLFTERRGLDKMINWGPNAVAISNVDKQMIRTIYQQELDATVKDVLGESKLAQYKAARNTYANLKTWSDAASDKAAALGANSPIALRDIGAAMVAGGGPMGLAAGYGAKVIRQRGDFIAGGILDDIAKARVLKGINLDVDKAIEKGVSDFLDAKAPALKSATKKVSGTFMRSAETMPSLIEKQSDRREWFREQQQMLQQPLNDVMDKVSAGTESISGVMPGLVGSMSNKALQNQTLLSSRMPKMPEVDSIIGGMSELPPSDTELWRYAKYYEGVHNPLSILQDMKSHSLTQEKVDGVRDAFPKIFGKIQAQILQQQTVTDPLAAPSKGKKGKKLSYGQNIQLGIMFGVKAHPTLDPAFISSIQKQYAAAQQAPSPPAQGGAPNVASKTQTPLQKVESGT